MRVLFLSFVVSVWLLINAYVLRSLLGGPIVETWRESSALWRSVIVAFWVMFVWGVAAMFGGRLSGGEAPLWLVWPGYIWLGATFILLALFVLWDLGFAISKLAMGAMERPLDESRRAFLLDASRATITAITASVVGYGTRVALAAPEVEEVDVPIDGLPEALNGYRIVQVSDIHVGPTIKGEFARDLVNRVNELEPDMIAVTGDMVDGSVAMLSKYTREFAAFDAPDGVFFCTGNHEYYSGAEEWVRELRSYDWNVLLNEHRVIEKEGATLVVAGCTDYSTSDTDPQKALEGAPEHDCSVLLAHQPKSIKAAKAAGYDLQISGHTHGGQFFPANMFVGFFHPFSVGLGKAENTWIYVNRGTGYWGPPNRAGVPPEITVLTLVQA